MTEGWLEALNAHVEREWTGSGHVLLLSEVPSLLTRDGFDMQAILQGRKLRPFLQAETADRFKLIQSDPTSIVWGLAPLHADVAEPFNRYFRRATGPKPLRFAPSFWKAFTLPIEEGKRRWVFDEPSIHFRDEDADSSPEAGYEIERRFIVPSEDGAATGDVYRSSVLTSIGSWGVEMKVDPSRFSLGRKKVHAPRSEPAASITEKNNLDLLLSLLHPTELSRISLPLDIVARLKGVGRSS